MNQHLFENAPDGAWDDPVFLPTPGEGRAFIAPPPPVVSPPPPVMAPPLQVMAPPPQVMAPTPPPVPPVEPPPPPVVETRPPAALLRLRTRFAIAVVLMAALSAGWWLMNRPTREVTVLTAPVPVQKIFATAPPPATPPAAPPRPGKPAQPAARSKPSAPSARAKPAVKNVEVNQARSFGPTP